MDGYNVIERFDGQHALASLCRHQAISSVPCAVRSRTGWLKQHPIFRKCAIEPLWAACRDCWLHSTMASVLLGKVVASRTGGTAVAKDTSQPLTDALVQCEQAVEQLQQENAELRTLLKHSANSPSASTGANVLHSK